MISDHQLCGTIKAMLLADVAVYGPCRISEQLIVGRGRTKQLICQNVSKYKWEHYFLIGEIKITESKTSLFTFQGIWLLLSLINEKKFTCTLSNSSQKVTTWKKKCYIRISTLWDSRKGKFKILPDSQSTCSIGSLYNFSPPTSHQSKKKEATNALS